MPNYINTSGLVDGQTADANDVKTPLETLDQELFDVANGNKSMTPDIDGDLLLDPTGSDDTNPRKLGVTGMGSGERMRLPLGDELTAIQSGNSRSLDIYAFYGIRLMGARNNMNPLGYTQINDASVFIQPGKSDKIGLVVKGKNSQSVPLQEWRDGGDVVLVSIDEDGELNTLKQTLYAVAAPTSGPADAVQIWADDSGGSAVLKVRDEAGNISTLSSHTPQIVETGGRATSYVHQEYNPYSGKHVEMDVYGALEQLETLTGKRFIHVESLPQSMCETWDEIEKVPAVADALNWEDTRDEESIIERQQERITELESRLNRMELLLGSPIY